MQILENESWNIGLSHINNLIWNKVFNVYQNNKTIGMPFL